MSQQQALKLRDRCGSRDQGGPVSGSCGSSCLLFNTDIMYISIRAFLFGTLLWGSRAGTMHIVRELGCSFDQPQPLVLPRLARLEKELRSASSGSRAPSGRSNQRALENVTGEDLEALGMVPVPRKCLAAGTIPALRVLREITLNRSCGTDASPRQQEPTGYERVSSSYVTMEYAALCVCYVRTSTGGQRAPQVIMLALITALGAMPYQAGVGHHG